MRLASWIVTATTLLLPFIHADDTTVTTLTNTNTPVTVPAVQSGITTNAHFEDLIVNIGKLYVDADIDFDREKHDRKKSSRQPYTQPSTGDDKKPVKVHDDDEDTPSAQDTSNDIDWAALFPELELSAEPAADEVVLGENNVTDVSVQGGQQQDGVIIVSTPLVFSVTFKILQSKVITMAGADLTTFTNQQQAKPKKELVTFVIRGEGFTVGGTQNFGSVLDLFSGTSSSGLSSELLRQQDGLGSFLAPRVYIGDIPLQVVQFTDTLIVARFLDLEDQRRFQPGAYLTRVKVLRFSQRQEQKDGKEIGVLGGEDGSALTTPILSAAANVPSVILIGGLPVNKKTLSGPFGNIGGGLGDGLGGLGGIGGGHGNKKQELTTGFEFFTAVLNVQFSLNDALAIRNSVPILDTWYE